jgi:hypothetical protein
MASFDSDVKGTQTDTRCTKRSIGAAGSAPCDWLML